MQVAYIPIVKLFGLIINVLALSWLFIVNMYRSELVVANKKNILYIINHYVKLHSIQKCFFLFFLPSDLFWKLTFGETLHILCDHRSRQCVLELHQNHLWQLQSLNERAGASEPHNCQPQLHNELVSNHHTSGDSHLLHGQEESRNS